MLGIDASDFPPPIMQQSKTPNNIKSVIRQVNFVRAPKETAKAQGGKVVQKVIIPKASKASAAAAGNSSSIPNSSRQKKRSIDFTSIEAQQ